MNKLNGLTFFVFLVCLGTNLFAVNPPAAIGDSANILLWLSPDSGVYNASGTVATSGQDVAEWRDISGNGFVFTNTFTARRPVLSSFQGSNYLDFTSGDFLENTPIKDSINGLTEFSIFVTIKSDVTGTDNGFLDCENPNNTDDKICMRYDSKNGSTNNCILVGLNGNSANDQVLSNANAQTTNVQVITATWKQGGRLFIYVDGVLQDSSTNTISTALSSVSKIIVGKGPKDNKGGLGGGAGWDGLIGELLFYNKQYSADTIQQVSSSITSVTSVKSGNWNDTTVWDCSCVPPYLVDVTIAANHLVTLDSSVHLKSLTVNTGGTIDLTANNFNLDLSKHLNVNGTIEERLGSVSFSGSEISYITGTFDLYDLRIEKSTATVQPQSGMVTVLHSLDVASGTLDANNLITLKSTSSLTANLGQVNGTISGNLRIQRYVGGLSADVGFRHFSLPIQNGTINNVQLDSVDHPGGLLTWGFTGSNYPSLSGYNSTYTFSESGAVGANDFNSGWVSATSSAQSFTYESAMTFYCGGSGYPEYNLEVSGVPNQGTQTISNMSYSSTNGAIGGGWHFIGNPYASAIDWSGVSRTNVDAIAYVYSETSGGYVASNLLPNANIIAPFQGFFVRVSNGTNTVQFEESDKSTQSPDFVRSQNNQNRLRMKIKNRSNGKYTPVALDINDEATVGFDHRFDAYKMENPWTFPVAYFMADTNELQVSALSRLDLMDSVDLHTGNHQSGDLELEIEEVPNLQGCLVVFDRITGKRVEVTVGETYIFKASSQGVIENRFVIYLENALSHSNKTDLSCFGSNDGRIEIEMKGLTQPWYLVRNRVDTVHIGLNEFEEVSGLHAGYYELQTAGWGSCKSYSQSYSINQPQEIKPQFELNNRVEVGEELNILNTTSGANKFKWSFGNGDEIEAEHPMYAYALPGRYQVELKASMNACSATHTAFVEVFEPGPPSSIQSVRNADFKVYSSGEGLHVDIEVSGSFDIVIYDQLGKLLHKTTVSESTEVELNHEGLVFVYVVSTSSGDQIVTKVWLNQ